MLESLKGPKGSIIEGLLPLVTMAAIILWVVFAEVRKHIGKPLNRSLSIWVGLLIFVVGISSGILYPIYLGARPKAALTSCISNFKQLNLCMLQYVQDWDDKLPPAAQWTLITNYGRYSSEKEVWHCPEAATPYSYAFNKALSRLCVDDLDQTNDTVNLFENDASVWNATGGKGDLPEQARHNGGFCYGFLDGHAAFGIGRDDYAGATALIWKPHTVSKQEKR